MRDSLIRDLNISIERNKFILLYGEPSPYISIYFLDLLKKIIDKEEGITVIMDVNNIFNPKLISLIGGLDEDRLLIYKPFTLEDNILYLETILYSSNEEFSPDYILITNIYIHFKKEKFIKTRYDPIYLMALCKSLVKEDKVRLIIGNIDTSVEEANRLPYFDYLCLYVDYLYRKIPDKKRIFIIEDRTSSCTY
ncbi:hypothetical protein DRN87_00050 [Candidatus Geothermarchaeota archaeon]|nr:MAG: hypothetical protein DRN87_00050 [Candidatus Geothermarchaeota archaeon]